MTGLDIDPDKIKVLNSGRSYIARIPAERITKSVKASFQASVDFAMARNRDSLIICVSVSLGKHREPVVNFIGNTWGEVPSGKTSRVEPEKSVVRMNS